MPDLPNYQWLTIIFSCVGIVMLPMCWPRKDRSEIIRPEKHHATLDSTTIAQVLKFDYDKPEFLGGPTNAATPLSRGSQAGRSRSENAEAAPEHTLA